MEGGLEAVAVSLPLRNAKCRPLLISTSISGRRAASAAESAPLDRARRVAGAAGSTCRLPLARRHVSARRLAARLRAPSWTTARPQPRELGSGRCRCRSWPTSDDGSCPGMRRLRRATHEPARRISSVMVAGSRRRGIPAVEHHRDGRAEEGAAGSSPDHGQSRCRERSSPWPDWTKDRSPQARGAVRVVRQAGCGSGLASGTHQAAWSDDGYRPALPRIMLMPGGRRRCTSTRGGRWSVASSGRRAVGNVRQGCGVPAKRSPVTIFILVEAAAPSCVCEINGKSQRTRALRHAIKQLCALFGRVVRGGRDLDQTRLDASRGCLVISFS